MTTDSLPGFAQDDDDPPGGRQPGAIAQVTRNPELYDRRFDELAARGQRFARGLTAPERVAVAGRPRFRNQPWLRLVGGPYLDDGDEIPGLDFPRNRPPGPNYP